MHDEHGIRDAGKIILHDIRRPDLGEEGRADGNLPVESHGHVLALRELTAVRFGEHRIKDLMHIDRGAAKRDQVERIAVFLNISQRKIAAEAGGIAIEPLGMKRFFCPSDHGGKVCIAVVKAQLLPHVLAVTGPVETEHCKLLVFRKHVLRKARGRTGALMPGEAVAVDDRVLGLGVPAVEQAPDIVLSVVYRKCFGLHRFIAFLCFRAARVCFAGLCPPFPVYHIRPLRSTPRGENSGGGGRASKKGPRAARSPL